MKVSINWLKELVKLNTTLEELLHQLDMKTIGIKEITKDYFELDMKGYNRADLLSLRGIAYEAAAITDSQITFSEPKEADYPWIKEKLPDTPVKVEALDLCPLYCIAKIEGLKVAKSPDEWAGKLVSAGMRSINNVADITNLIMLEYGQPMHAFDASKVKDSTLIVRVANIGEEIETLDHKKRVLEPLDLVIADPEKAVGIAGIMGGKDSEIGNTTTTVFLEAAIFNPTSIRHTAGRLGLQSEASRRFQHGLAKKRLLQALDAAIRMYQEMGGKLTAISITDHLEEKPQVIPVSYEKLISLIGVAIGPEEAKTYLEKLHFDLARGWTVTPPYWRLDVSIEADVIEEVARIYGYENITAKTLEGGLPEKVDQSLFELISKLKQSLADAGLDEIQTYSFYSTKVLNGLNVNKEELIKIANPMSAETEYLRNSLIPNALEKIGDNLKNFSQVGIFELGKVYQVQENDPTEKYHLAAGLTDSSDNPLASLYTLLQKAIARLGVKLELGDRPLAEYEKALSHPNKFARLMYQGQEIGYMAEVHPRAASKLGIDKRVAVLEITLEDLI